MQSETIGKLAAALVKAQREMPGAQLDSKNPFFSSTYASLTSVWLACRKALTDNDLCIIQTTAEADDPQVIVVTTLAHSSGEWISGHLAMTAKKASDPQAIGSAITYARRYALAAMVGISPADDDGNAASEPTAKRKPKKAAKPKPSTRVDEVFEDNATGTIPEDLLPMVEELKAIWERVNAKWKIATLDEVFDAAGQMAEKNSRPCDSAWLNNMIDRANARLAEQDVK